MEINRKQKKISIIIYAILFTIIIGLSTTLIYFNDLYKEYTVPYTEKCYKVEYDENSITTITYDNNDKSSVISSMLQMNFENGKAISDYEKWIYKTKASAKMDYKHIVAQKKAGIANYADEIKLNKNVIELKTNLLGKISYDSKEEQEKVESFTTNEEIITYLLEEGEKNNFWLSDEYKRIY